MSNRLALISLCCNLVDLELGVGNRSRDETHTFPRLTAGAEHVMHPQ